MALNGKACRYWRPLMLSPCKWIPIKWLGYRAWSTWNFEAIGGSERNLRLFFLSGPGLSASNLLPWKGYILRKAIELKLTGIALNRSKNHIGETTTNKGVQVGIFLN